MGKPVNISTHMSHVHHCMDLMCMLGKGQKQREYALQKQREYAVTCVLVTQIRAVGESSLHTYLCQIAARHFQL